MIKLLNGDCLEVMKNLPTGSVDLVVTDPPYDIHAGKGGGAFGNRNRPYQNLVDSLAYGITDEILKL